MEKKLKKAVAVTIVALCAVIMCARSYAQSVSFYSGIGGSLNLADEVKIPAFAVKLGMDVSNFIVEIEGTAISILANFDDELNEAHYKSKKDMKMSLGANVGVKFFDIKRGYIALMLNTGCSVSENYYYDIYYDPEGIYGDSRYKKYVGEFYIGSGLRGDVKLSDTFSLFSEAGYRIVPNYINTTCGEDCVKMGFVFQAGMVCHF